MAQTQTSFILITIFGLPRAQLFGKKGFCGRYSKRKIAKQFFHNDDAQRIPPTTIIIKQNSYLTVSLRVTIVIIMDVYWEIHLLPVVRIPPTNGRQMYEVEIRLFFLQIYSTIDLHILWPFACLKYTKGSTEEQDFISCLYYCFTDKERGREW